MRNDPQRVSVESLESQLGVLKSRLREPDAARWRQIGKFAQEFTVWLERARPWISCASSLIALRVEQVVGEAFPGRACYKCLRKLSSLLDEASRQLARPGSPLQVPGLPKARAVRTGSRTDRLLLPGDKRFLQAVGIPGSADHGRGFPSRTFPPNLN